MPRARLLFILLIDLTDMGGADAKRLELVDSPRALVGLIATYLVVVSIVFTNQVTLDESGSWWMINADLASIGARAWTALKLPLYYGSIELWSRIGGDSVYFLRVFSILCSGCGMAATYWLANRLFDCRTAAWSLVFMIVNSSFLINGALARPYPLALLLVVLSTTQLVTFMQSGKVLSFVLWQLALVLSFYTHLYFLPVGLLHLYFVLTHPHRKPFFDSPYQWLIYAVGLLALYPILKQALIIRRYDQEIVYFDPSLTTTFNALLPVSVVVPLGLTVAIAVLRHHDLRPLAKVVLGQPSGRFVLAWVLFPAVFFGGYFLVTGQWLVLGRYIYYQVPALAILLGLFIQRLNRTEAIAVVMATVVCTGLNIRAEIASMNYSAPDLTAVANEIESADPQGACPLLTPSLFYESTFSDFYEDELHRSFFGAFSAYFIKHPQIVLPRSLTPENRQIFARRLDEAAAMPCLFVLAFAYNEVFVGGEYRQLSDYLARAVEDRGFAAKDHGASPHGLKYFAKN